MRLSTTGKTWSMVTSPLAAAGWGFAWRLIGGLAILLPGCGTPPPPPAEVRVTPAVSEDVREQLLDGAVAVLDRLDDYEEESAFAQVFDRLNQWSHAATIAGLSGASEWRVDPLFDGLSERLRAGSTPETLGSPLFDAASDVAALRDQRWLADIAANARGDAVEDLDAQQRCVALFRTMGLSEMAHWAQVHLDIIARFGRFPHRNAVLGRASTPAEIAFLKAGGFAG